ncbi:MULTISPECIES: hypothetical protein [unclassified Moraxella]|uniref:hypothetical protein n=1 Tax=unclassified Moraxella TaxID=2685852 RepID=UPI003AF6C6EF
MTKVQRYQRLKFPKLGEVFVGYDLRVTDEKSGYFGCYGIIDRISSYTTESHSEYKLRLEFENKGVYEYLDFYEEQLSH